MFLLFVLMIVNKFFKEWIHSSFHGFYTLLCFCFFSKVDKIINNIMYLYGHFSFLNIIVFVNLLLTTMY